jgi:TrmH family RNA methyltransferase
MPRRITSRNHRVVKDTRRLRRTSFRDENGRFVVEGPGLISEAVRSGAKVRLMLFSPERSEQAEVLMGTASTGEGMEAYEITDELIEWVSDVVTSQGMLAVFEQIDRPYREIITWGPTLLLVADQVRDPGNLGSLIRVADAAGADAFLSTEGSADFYNTKIVRSSAGSMFHMPVARHVPLKGLATELKDAGVKMVGLDTRGGIDYLAEDFKSPVAVVMGNESYGFSDESRAVLDDTVSIDMPGHAESLNVATAAAVVMFEAVRQRRGLED